MQNNKEVIISYLRMKNKPLENYAKADFSLEEIDKPINTIDYLLMYDKVGKLFNWNDRHDISKEKLYEDINKSSTHVFLLKVDDEVIGFSELVEEGNHVELLYFGLFSDNIGKGYGKVFLNQVLHKAWAFDPQWIQLNTCTLDHPGAIGMYQKAGFKVTETKVRPY